MSIGGRIVFSISSFGALTIAAFLLARRGVYGWTLFVLLPVIAGWLGSWSGRPKTVTGAVQIGVLTGVAGCGLFLLLNAEGIICVLLALPVVVPLAIVGSLLGYFVSAFTHRREGTAMCLLLPVSLFVDGNATPPVYSVTTSIVVNVPPERVWKHLVAFPDITDHPDWLLSTGLAYPIRTRLQGPGLGAARNCDLSTGTVQERVSVWDEPRLLRFEVIATPPAMREMGLYGPIYPKHLNGYYISKAGQFELTSLPGGRTLVMGTSWYQHGLWPAEYWRWWTDRIVHHIHRRVLEHIRMLSEHQD